LKKKVKALGIFLSISLLVLGLPFVANAEGQKSYETFSSTPDTAEIERQKQYELAPGSAWEVDLQGNVKPAPYIVPHAKSPNEKTITPMSWSDGSYDYVYYGYTSTDTKLDSKKFFISKVTVENQSLGPLPLKYTQQETVTTYWSVSANISAEGELKVQWLASLKVSLGGSYSYSKTTYSSTQIEAGPKDIPPGYSASYTKYRAGGYGKGQAAWKKYIKGYSSWVGMYYTNESGWAPHENQTTIVYEEHRL